MMRFFILVIIFAEIADGFLENGFDYILYSQDD
jgi:hypothetical protein